MLKWAQSLHIVPNIDKSHHFASFSGSRDLDRLENAILQAHIATIGDIMGRDRGIDGGAWLTHHWTDCVGLYAHQGLKVLLWRTKTNSLESCVGFIDGKVFKVISTGQDRLQKDVYKDHKRVHALKFQSVTLPDAMIWNMNGLVERRRHDGTLYTS